MQKNLLVALLLGISLSCSAAAQIPRPPKHKKSKEIALIKAIGGGYIAVHHLNILLNLFIQPFQFADWNQDVIFYSRKLQTRASFMLSIIGAIIAKNGFNDLDEIAQKE